MPELCGSTTVSATKVASAASAALPPARNISAPASAARGSAALTIPGTVEGATWAGVAQPLTASSAAKVVTNRRRIGWNRYSLPTASAMLAKSDCSSLRARPAAMRLAMPGPW